MRTLSDDERNQVLGAMNQLTDLPPEKWPSDRVHLRHAQKGLYLLDADEELRVIFRREPEGTLTFINLVMRESLERTFWTQVQYNPNAHRDSA